MSTFSDNVQKLRVSKGLTQRQLAEKLQVSKSTIGKWESSDTLPDYSGMKEISEFFGVSVGALFWEDLDSANLAPFVDVRVFGRIAAGTPIEMEEGDYAFPAPIEIMKHHPRAFFLETEGESMNRKIPNGSYALIDPDRTEPLIDGRAYAVCVNGYDATLKRVHQLSNGIELVPDSTDPTIKPIVFDFADENAETVTILGEVVWYSIPFDFEI